MLNLPNTKKFTLAMTICLILAASALAQTTSFTYQGRLTDNTIAANGTYQMQFALYDGSNVQIGSTITNSTVQVVNGIFTVALDFGAGAFPGSSRFLQIGVFSTATSAFVPLTPRQPMTSAPYAVRSLNAGTADIADNSQQLGGIAAGQYVQTADPRMTDARDPLAGSSNYVQNSTVTQPLSNFNVSGNGTANTFNAATQYNIGGSRVLSVPGNHNTFAGLTSGQSNTTGTDNSSFGFQAGQLTTFGWANSFFGSGAGATNLSGGSNSFFGSSAGGSNTGSNNSFFGQSTGSSNKNGDSNAFFGDISGFNNLSGNFNAFFGSQSGLNNSTGSRNTIIGFLANVGSGNLTNASVLGSGAFVTTSNSLVLGSINGVNAATADTNVGIGTTAPKARLHVAANGGTILAGDPGCVPGFAGIGFSASLTCTNYSLLGEGSNTILNSPVNGKIFFRAANVDRMTVTSAGNIGINTTSPAELLHIATPSAGNILLGDPGCAANYGGIGFGTSLSGCTNYSLVGNGTDTIVNRPTGGTIHFREGNSEQVAISPGGKFIVYNLASSGNISLCMNVLSQIANCSSSLRYKKDLQPFNRGLTLLNQLKPITFKWKSDNSDDLGFGAEEVAKVEPLLVSHNSKGEIEGVKYDRISAVLVNAVKEQQAQIELQQKHIALLEARLAQVERNARKRSNGSRRNKNVVK